MFQKHPSFLAPNNPDQKCWRYLDFTKFVDLIDSSQLYFSRVDKLEDPFEGTFTKKTYDKKIEAGVHYSNHYIKARMETVVSCWHMNDYESAAMWNLYLKSNEGIAIQTTYKRLIKAISKEKRYYNYIGKVNYLDYETEEFDFHNGFNAFLCKRMSFEHEKEIRIIINSRALRTLPFYPKRKLTEDGLKIDVNLKLLIENIFVSPTAPAWMVTLISSLLKKYNLNTPIKKSALNGDILI